MHLLLQPRAVHDARWQPWLGCWSPSGAVSSAVAATMLCVVPGPTSSSVEIVNYSGGAVTDRALIDPGQTVAKQAEDCKDRRRPRGAQMAGV
jgi:hypothetical protein